MDKYIGKRLDGRYEIREVIGVGGMAYVYKAYDTIDDRTVAIKILKDEFLANEEFTRRFKNESKAIAILSHPNIVKVFDVSFGNRIQYIVMEFIDGITLKEYIEQQKDIRWKEAVHFTVQILRALQHAHDKGIVHRDIKPQNIMLLPDGTIKVTDFGIARFARSDIRVTSAAEKAIGSVHYISPEQARGEITDEKADIYSVGVMLYEMLSGKLPFEADNAVSIAIMQMQTEPKKIREINPDIPDGLEEITVKAMQKDPAKRYQSAAEMLYDIDEFKRNPSIHFAYKYFVDETPTRFVDAITRVKGSEPEELNENDGDEAEQEETEKKFPVIPVLAGVAGAFVVAALLFAGVVFLLEIFDGKKTEDIVVPNLIGQDYTEVVKNKDITSKFTIENIPQWSETIPKNQIFNQYPESPKTVKIGDTIKLYVSMGPKLIKVPDVTKNEHMDVVKKRLEDEGFEVQTAFQTSNDVQKDFVIKIDPPSGEELAKGSVVTMYVSSGVELPDPEPVPYVVSTNIESAKAIIKQNGFNVGTIEYVNSNDYPKDIVISQDPPKDTMATPGTKINLKVSSGFKDFKLPVALPRTTVALDMCVYVDGDHVSKFDKNRFVPYNSVDLLLTIQKEEYPVRIMLRKYGTTKWIPYAEYLINCINQTIESETKFVDDSIFYENITTTTTTTATTTSTEFPDV
jgi:beta-lactam-binding protein with PASTA domain/tRNA A-37 threonylcarbamoyl transferase component Bud32